MRSSVKDILSRLGANLGAVAHPYTTRSVPDRIYEAYIFALTIASAAESGALVRFVQGDGQQVNRVSFRGSGGYLHARSGRWTHAALRFGQAPDLEVHVRVKVVGKKTKIEGECDLLIIDGHTADTSRYKNEAPPGLKCAAIVECKFYSAETLPISLGREFANLCVDRGSKHLAYFVSNQRGPMVWKTVMAESNTTCEFEVFPTTSTEVDLRERHFQTLVREAFKRHVCYHDPSVAM